MPNFTTAGKNEYTPFIEEYVAVLLHPMDVLLKFVT